MPQEFHEQLTEFLPKMRIWALALTRNRAAAEDLTQDVATKALIAKDCFIPGTNFSAWVHRIMINHFISSVRSKRCIQRPRPARAFAKRRGGRSRRIFHRPSSAIAPP